MNPLVPLVSNRRKAPEHIDQTVGGGEWPPDVNFQTSRGFGRSGRLNDGNGTNVFACHTSDSRSYPLSYRSAAAFGLWDQAGGVRGSASVRSDAGRAKELGQIADDSGAARTRPGLNRHLRSLSFQAAAPRNSTRAAPRAASVTVSPASIRAISSTRACGDSGTTRLVVTSPVTCFSTRQ